MTRRLLPPTSYGYAYHNTARVQIAIWARQQRFAVEDEIRNASVESDVERARR